MDPRTINFVMRDRILIIECGNEVVVTPTSLGSVFKADQAYGAQYSCDTQDIQGIQLVFPDRKITPPDMRNVLRNMLPHGAGINGDWLFIVRSKSVTAFNNYDLMNNQGMYCGTVEFSLIIPKKEPWNFRLHFHGKSYRYYIRYWDVRTYLEDMFAEEFTENKEKYLEVLRTIK